jgi:hypothetical protein
MRFYHSGGRAERAGQLCDPAGEDVSRKVAKTQDKRKTKIEILAFSL